MSDSCDAVTSCTLHPHRYPHNLCCFSLDSDFNVYPSKRAQSDPRQVLYFLSDGQSDTTPRTTFFLHLFVLLHRPQALGSPDVQYEHKVLTQHVTHLSPRTP